MYDSTNFQVTEGIAKEDKKIAVVIPCLNEETGLKKILKKLPLSVSQVIVVDNDSTDNTAKVAKEQNAIVLFEKKRGKGHAFKKFLEHFPEDFDADIVVMIDGDNTYDIRDLHKIVKPLYNGSKVVMGERFTNNELENSMSFPTYWGNRFLTNMAKILYSEDPKDLCTGYWAFSRDFLRKVKIDAKGFDLEANLFTEAVKKKFKIEKVPIKYGVREGKSKLKYNHGFVIFWRLLINRFNF